MRKMFLPSMLGALVIACASLSYAQTQSGPGVSHAPPKAVQSILNHIFSGKKQPDRAGNDNVLDVNVLPYYSAPTAINSVSMKTVVPAYPATRADQIILISYTVAESKHVLNNLASGLTALLVYCGPESPCGSQHGGSWILQLNRDPEDTEWPTAIVKPGDVVSLDWTGQGEKWSLHARVKRSDDPAHRLILTQSLNTSVGMHFVTVPALYAESPTSSNCNLLPPALSAFDIRMAVPNYDPKNWQTVPVTNQMDCTVHLTLPSQSPGKIEMTWR